MGTVFCTRRSAHPSPAERARPRKSGQFFWLGEPNVVAQQHLTARLEPSRRIRTLAVAMRNPSRREVKRREDQREDDSGRSRKICLAQGDGYEEHHGEQDRSAQVDRPQDCSDTVHALDRP
jgi:hypothetical protein